jgi:Ca2+-binding EF-hand superfamily protein
MKYDGEINMDSIEHYMKWDKDKDGCLSLEEFRKMNRGEQ